VGLAAVVLLGGLGIVAAEAASSGTVSLSVTGAKFVGTYQYDVYVNSTRRGILYKGTLSNTSTSDANDAHFYAQVSGYGYTELALAQPGKSASVNRVVFDPQALYVTTSKAQACRDRTLLGQNCQVGTYNK
jgi:hypothetical protein